MIRGLLLLCVAIGVWSADLTPHDYRARLERISATIDAEDLPTAGTLAIDLAAQQVAWERAVLPTDPRISAALAAGHPGTARRRIGQLLAALDERVEPHTTAIDRQALEAIAHRQQAAQLAAGGTLGELNLRQPEPLKPLAERFRDAWKWLGDLANDLWDWLHWLFGQDPRKPKAEGESGTTLWVLIGLGVIVVVVIVLALRRTTAPLPASVAAPLPVDAAEDQDPRSRAADEWIRHARALAAEGRQREAVRAWYHALLVTCWARGHLHHRTGRTNWEYAVALATALPWSTGFRDLTARFDRTWYGGQEDPAYAADAEDVVTRIRGEVRP